MKTKTTALKVTSSKENHPLKEELFQIIMETMKRDEISQAEVARRIGAQRYNINKILQKKMPVSMEFLIEIAEALDLQVELKFRKIKS